MWFSGKAPLGSIPGSKELKNKINIGEIFPSPILFRTGSLQVAQAGLELVIVLIQESLQLTCVHP